jgi:hypothetical protein
MDVRTTRNHQTKEIGQMSKAMMQELRDRLHQISGEWIDRGLPGRDAIEKAAADLSDWKRRHQVQGIWARPPSMLTATLDDGIGHGLALIERFAAVMGASVQPLGLLQQPETIITACNRRVPDFLGLTVLQLESDDALALVGHNLPPATCLIAGGPAFRYDRDMADRCAVGHVAENVAYFIDYLLHWTRENDPER